jgi:hypothetical protein
MIPHRRRSKMQSYDDVILQGVEKANKLKAHWDVLYSELGCASESLSKYIGLVVRWEVIESSAAEAPVLDAIHQHFPGKVCHIIRMSCPELKYESKPLAWVLSCPEGLPFLLRYVAYQDNDSSHCFHVRVSDERQLQESLSSFVVLVMKSVQTDVLIRELAVQAKAQIAAYSQDGNNSNRVG